MAVDMFLKISGIDGESNSHKHKDEIELFSWSWGLSQTLSGGGGGAGKVQAGDFTVVKFVDKASPLLMEACCTGKHIPDVTLTLSNKGSQQDFYKIKLEDVLISSYQTGGGSTGGAVPTDQVSFNFSRMSIQAGGKGQSTDVSCNFQKGGGEIFQHDHEK